MASLHLFGFSSFPLHAGCCLDVKLLPPSFLHSIKASILGVAGLLHLQLSAAVHVREHEVWTCVRLSLAFRLGEHKFWACQSLSTALLAILHVCEHGIWACKKFPATFHVYASAIGLSKVSQQHFMHMGMDFGLVMLAGKRHKAGCAHSCLLVYLRLHVQAHGIPFFLMRVFLLYAAKLFEVAVCEQVQLLCGALHLQIS